MGKIFSCVCSLITMLLVVCFIHTTSVAYLYNVKGVVLIMLIVLVSLSLLVITLREYLSRLDKNKLTEDNIRTLKEKSTQKAA